MTRRIGVGAGAVAALIALGAAASAWAQDDGPLGPPANVFIAPTGQVFRAKEGLPYPVAVWFKQVDTNGDGKIDKAEFVADAAMFFKIIDRNGDGAISPKEVAYYEQRIAPEILGYRVDVNSGGAMRPLRPAILWKAQVPGGVGGGGAGGAGGIDRPGSIDPGGANLDGAPHGPQKLDESGTGASPFSFFDEPEPVMAADLGFHGYVVKADYLRLAEIHFRTLDFKGLGYLTLPTLPETPMQKRLTRGRHRR